MKILVTGSNGFLGRGIVEQLYEYGHNVIAADIQTDNVTDKVKRINCDLFTIENPYEFFDKPDIVLHLAWRDGFVHNSISHIEDLPKHFKFLNLMANSGIKKICVMGSMHEIGFHEGSIDENTPCHPQSYYGIAKNSLRSIMELLCNDKHIVFQWLRGYYIVSNTSFGNSIFSKIVKAEAVGEKEFPFTTGQNQYDFLNYDDFCKQVVATVSQDKINGIINICSGIPQKLAERVEQFIKENNFSIKLKYGAFPDRVYDSKAVWGNSRKINNILSDNIQ